MTKEKEYRISKTGIRQVRTSNRVSNRKDLLWRRMISYLRSKSYFTSVNYLSTTWTCC